MEQDRVKAALPSSGAKKILYQDDDTEYYAIATH